MFALVDDADYELVSKHDWCANKCGNKFYASKAGVRMHRFIMGVLDSKIIVDHIDGDTLNNQRNNLRTCTKAHNNINTSAHKNTTSRYKGVSWAKHCKKWRAQITKDKFSKFIGYYDNELDAAIAYNNVAKNTHGEFANLNKVTQ